jgi:tetratricopeptide (TPR) repeat protein
LELTSKVAFILSNIFRNIDKQIKLKVWRVLIYNAGHDAKSGRMADAEQKLVQALPLAEQIVSLANADELRNAELNLSRNLSELAAAYRYGGKADEAKILSARAIELTLKYAPDDVGKEIAALLQKAGLFQREKQLEEAVLLVAEARALGERSYGAEDPRIVAVLHEYGHLMLLSKRFDESEKVLMQALTIRKNTCAPNDPDLAVAMMKVAQIMRLQNRLDDAVEEYKNALSVLENPIDSIVDAVGEIAKAGGDFSKIAKAHDRSIGMEHPVSVLILVGLARIYQKQNKLSEAYAVFQRALKISEARKPIDKQESVRVLEKFAKFLRAAGNPERAAELEEKAKKLGG